MLTLAEQYLADCAEAGEECCSVCGHTDCLCAYEHDRIGCIRCGCNATVRHDGQHLVAVWDIHAEA